MDASCDVEAAADSSWNPISTSLDRNRSSGIVSNFSLSFGCVQPADPVSVCPPAHQTYTGWLVLSSQPLNGGRTHQVVAAVDGK